MYLKTWDQVGIRRLSQLVKEEENNSHKFLSKVTLGETLGLRQTFLENESLLDVIPYNWRNFSSLSGSLHGPRKAVHASITSSKSQSFVNPFPLTSIPLAIPKVLYDSEPCTSWRLSLILLSGQASLIIT